MKKVHISVLSDCIHQFDQKVLKKCSEVPSLAALIKSGSLVIQGNATHKETSVILGDPTRVLSVLQRADLETGSCALSQLQWVQSTFAGVNTIVQNHARDDYVLTRTGGFGPQMSEYCMGWALFVQQQMSLAQQHQRKKKWDSSAFSHRGGLRGKTLGVLGVGDIGSAVAGGAKAFNMHTLGLSSSSASAAANTDPHFDQVTASLEEVVRQCDVLVNTLPSTPHTCHLLTHSLLQRCARSPSRALRPAPLFINIGRGDIISSSDLLAALEGRDDGEERRGLSHAVLDVVEEEPLQPCSPLWTHPRVNITPHIAAVSTPELVLEVFVHNLEQFLQVAETEEEGKVVLAETLRFVVDREKGY